MKIGSLFSGIGGLELGLEWSGLGNTIWQVERDPYCLKVLAKHWPNVERFTDVKEAGKNNLSYADIICGGFPCQDVSSAGKRAGIAVGTRSGLWFEFRRIIGELSPAIVIVENVASGVKAWLPTVRRDLHLLGYGTSAMGISAGELGAPHLRKRVFVIAYSASLLGDGGEHQRSRLCESIGTREEILQFGNSGNTPVRRNCNWWSSEPNVGRVAHGVSGKLDRLKGLGNAVVPQCAKIVGLVIKQKLENIKS